MNHRFILPRSLIVTVLTIAIGVNLAVFIVGTHAYHDPNHLIIAGLCSALLVADWIIRRYQTICDDYHQLLTSGRKDVL